MTPSSIHLRDYQRDAIAAILAARDHGVRRQLLVLPTGSGKTIVFAELIRRLDARALVLAHRDELITQAVDKVRLVAPDLSIGVVKAEKNETDAQVIVGSVQTLARPGRLAQLPTNFGLVVVDEAHHAPAASYQAILHHVRAGDPDGPLLLGCTATADRGDGAGLDGTFDHIVYETPLPDLVARGYLSDLRGTRIHYKADFSQLQVRAGDVTEASAAAAFRGGGGPAAVANALQRHAPRRKALIFCPDVDTSYETAAAINQLTPIPAAAVDGGTPLDGRRDILRRFAAGELQAIANCALLGEGFDEPSVDCVVIARPTKSRGLYAQMIGRGTRRHPGKDDCLILDLAGTTTRHELVTVSSLFGVAEDHADGELLSDALARKQQRIERAAMAGAVADVRLTAQAVELFQRRPVHWVPVDDGRYVLAAGDSQIILRPEDGESDRWSVIERCAGGAINVLVRGVPLLWAQGLAEDHVRGLGVRTLVQPDASWRSEPATAKQRAYLRSLRVTAPAGLLRGEASDLIAAARARQALARGA